MYIVCKIPPITQYGHIMVRKECFFNFNGMLGLWEEEKMIPAQDYKNCGEILYYLSHEGKTHAGLSIWFPKRCVKILYVII